MSCKAWPRHSPKAALKQGIKALFPEASINVEKLLSDIDAQTRQAIFDEAMRHDKTFLDAALMVFKNAEIAKATIGQPHAKTGAQIYAEVVGSSTLNNVNDVVASTGGDSASLKFQREGLRLYALATQMNANRLMLQIQLQPETATTDEAVLVNTLRTSRTHLLKVVNEWRAEQIRNRMDPIKDCEVYYVGTDYIHMKNVYYTRYRDEQAGKYWGEYDSFDRQTALGRCEADRDGHMQRNELALTQQLNANWGFELSLSNEWVKAADAIEKKSAAQSTLYSGLDFGGMWGYVRADGTPSETPTNNPFTGSPSCPSGYDQQMIIGKMNIDFPAYQCVRPSNGVAEPVADFGGMYGNMDYREARYTSKNPITGASSCPATFTAYQILGGGTADNALWFCAKPHAAGTKPAYAFGGAFSRLAGYANPASGVAACAPGFVPNQIWGSNGTNGWKVDQALNLCTKAP